MIAVVEVFTGDEPWSTAGMFAVVGGGSALITWGLLAATTPRTREVISGLLDILELLHIIGRLCGLILRGIGGLFRVFD